MDATMARDLRPTVVVMAKAPVPGRVKTRLAARWTAGGAGGAGGAVGATGAGGAAAIHDAMLRCTLDRTRQWLGPRCDGLVLCIDRLGTTEPVEVGPPWRVVPQGDGDLGRRMATVWAQIGGGAVIFLGGDSPDVPADVLRGAVDALGRAPVVIGPAADGGYWLLGARTYQPRLLHGIDWGGPAVYDETLARAAESGLPVNLLPPWTDVDEPADLDALRDRLRDQDEPALASLHERLSAICKDVCP
jgi:rSAM/selenodomain-associated transferase 1